MYGDAFDLYSRAPTLDEEEENPLLRLASPYSPPAPEPAPVVAEPPPVPEGFVEEEPPVPEGFVEEQPTEEPPIPEGYVEEVPEEVAPPEEEGLLKKAGRFALATGQLLAPNLGQAKAVLDPDTQKAAIETADKTKDSLRSGWLSGDVAQELQKPNPNLDYVAQQQRLIDTLKPDQDFQTAWDDNASAKDSWNAFAKDPLGNIGQLFGQSMGAMVRSAKDYAYKIPERTLQGGIAGTGIGAWFAGVGAGPGALLGLRGGFTEGMAEMNSMASYANEYAGSVISSLGEAGIDVKDPVQLKAAFSDPELMVGIRAKAEKKGVPVALFDGLSGAVNGNLFAAPGKTLGKKAWEWGAELLTDAFMGSAGETVSQLTSEGRITSPRSIAAEALMEPVQSVPQVVVGRTMAGLQALTEPLPEAPVVPGVTITPAPGEVPIPPDLAAPSPVTLPGVEPTGDERFAPPVTPPPLPNPVEPGQPPTPEGEAITKQVGAENLVVKEVADSQSVKLQSANAPETAKAIQQVAARSNAGATVSAAEFLQQARAQAAEAQAEADEKAAVEAEKAAKETAKAAPAGAVKPGEFAQPGYTAAAPAAEAPAQVAAQPTEYPAAVVVGGQVFTGATHEEATRAAHAAVGPDAMLSSEGGWVDSETGRFASHEIFEAHRDFNTAVDEAGGNMEAPEVQEAQARVAEAVARDEELNNQITRPGGEQVIQTGVKGQQALVSVRPSQELAVPLAGVAVNVEGVTPEGQRTIAQRPAAQALNDSRNDRTAFQILLNCLT